MMGNSIDLNELSRRIEIVRRPSNRHEVVIAHAVLLNTIHTGQSKIDGQVRLRLVGSTFGIACHQQLATARYLGFRVSV